MRILLICPHFAEYSLCLARALAEHHEVLLVLNQVNFDNEVGDAHWTQGVPGLRVAFTPHSRTARVLFENIKTYWRLFREFRPDVVHCQEELKDYLMLFLPLIGRTPMALTIHDPRPHLGADARRLRWTRFGLYERFMRQRADGIIVHGQSLYQEARRLPLLARTLKVVAPHGPLGLLSHRPRKLQGKPGRCLFFGRMQAYKGLDTFIDAVARLRAQGVPVQAVVAGRGEDLEHHRARLTPAAGFELIERYLSADEVVAQFDAAQIVVLPYHEATQSGVAAFALGRGRALVATDVGALPEVVEDGRTGLLVPPRDPEALAGALAMLIRDPARSAQMGEAAWQLGQDRLSWRTAALATTALYRQLLEA